MAVKLRKGGDFNNSRAVNLADGTAATDAVTLQQLQAMVRGLSWKDEVVVATTTNGALATAYANGQTIDGYTLVTGDRILLKNQTTQTENGIYTVNSSGAPTRAVDADSTAELESATVFVVKGTVNQNTAWTQTTDAPVIGTNNIVFAQFGGGSAGGYATVQEGGSPLTQRTTLNFGTGVVATDNSGSSRTDVDIDTALVVRKFAASCVVTTNPQTFNHALGTDVIIQVFLVATGEVIYPDITNTSTSGGTATVDYGAAPSAAEYRVVVHG